MRTIMHGWSLALLLCVSLYAQRPSRTQTQIRSPQSLQTSAALPNPVLVYGTTRYFNQLSSLSDFTLADVNRDGVLDLIAAESGTANIAVSLGDPAHPGTFLPPTFLPVQTLLVQSVSAVDLNADGLVDIVYGYYGDSTAFTGILFQDPQHPGSFLPSIRLGAPYIKPLIADMNHDGLPDIVLFEGYEGNGPAILFNDPQNPGSFRRTLPTSFPQAGTSAAIGGDMNGDGLPDIVISDDSMYKSVTVMLNDPAHPGSLLAPREYPAGGPTYFDLAAGDLNGDGLPDVVVGDLVAGISVLLNDPAHPGTLLPPHIYPVTTVPVGTESIGIALGDVNGDGKLDVAVGNYGSAFSLLLGNGDGTLAASTSYPTGPIQKTFFETSLAIADVDGDGLHDVVVGQLFQNSVQIFAHRVPAPSLAISATDQILSATSVRPGDPVSLTIKVSAFQGVPSGAVTVYSISSLGGTSQSTGTYTALAALPLDSTGTATYSDHLQSGSYNYRSFYPGDGTYAPSTSLFDTATVTAKSVVILSIAASPNPAAPGQNVVLTATVASMSSVPTGTIVFSDNGVIIGSATLNAAGTATVNTNSLILGTHTITAAYGGDTQYAPQQATTTELIANPASQFTLVSSLNPAPVGQAITFSAQISSAGPSPGGSVLFSAADNGISFHLVPLAADGTASYTTSSLTAGSHLIHATYRETPTTARSRTL